jgi:hypothetical protein
MRLVIDSGLWSTGEGNMPLATAPPLVALLEVSGAVLSWTVDDPPGKAATQISFTDLARADWLWRVLGESGHVALAAALASAADRAADEPHSIELAGVDIAPGSVDPLRRLAVGHWLRRWWPASRRDGIASLDRALLDVEVALLTAGAQGFFTDDTLDSDVTGLLAPHATALIAHVQGDDPRILDMVRAGAGLADEVGIDDIEWPKLFAAIDDSSAVLAPPERAPRRLRAGRRLGRGSSRCGADRPGRHVDQLERRAPRHIRCRREHRRMERRGSRYGGHRHRARSRDRTGPGHRRRRAVAVRGRQ